MGYLFSGGLIKCLGCGKNYKGKKFRNVIGYICSGNHHHGNEFCERFVVKESEIIDLINSHFDNQEWSIDLIQSIEIKDKTITIQYTDGSNSFLSGQHYAI
jgi:hypothetical protein